MIFAKDDNHATEIVDIAKNVFKPEFENDAIPEKFVQKITYSVGDSNALIRDLRTEKDFRIAVTVTLVATGTDVKPLEVVLFMKDVHSDVLYTQMKGRGCRVISDDKLKEVTPNADTKECYYIVDAVGVTESEKHVPKPGPDGSGKYILEQYAGVTLQEMPPEFFELFDYTLGNGVYVDFKLWKETMLISAEEEKKNVLEKLDKCGGKRTVIINIMLDHNMQITSSDSGRIIEIPYLYRLDRKEIGTEIIAKINREGYLQ